MAQALKLKVGNPLRKLVLIKLADNANDNGECWPSHSHIADHCEISDRSVRTHIKALEDAQFLTVINRVKDNKKQSNVYKLHFEKAQFNTAGDSVPNKVSTENGSKSTEGDSAPSTEGDSDRTSHSFESVKEPKKNINTKKSDLNFSAWHALGQIDQQTIDDWLALRKTKKSPASQTVINRFAKQLTLAVQAGFSASECLEVAITRGWTGFEFQWIKNHAQPRTNNFSSQQSGQFIPNHDDTSWADDWPESPFDQPAESAGQASGELRDITDHRDIPQMAGALPVRGRAVSAEAGLDANTSGAWCDE